VTPKARAHAAQAVLSIPLFDELMDELEQAAINACIYAKYDDHEARQAQAAEARAVRNLRSRLEAISQEGQSSERKQAPA
jgi:hypothetical protein